MTGQDYPIEHFRLMTDLSIHLKSIPVQLLTHEYTYDSFGSWLFGYEHHGKKFRVAFDGRNSSLALEEPVSETKPVQIHGVTWVNEWQHIRTILNVSGEREEVIKTILKLISGENV